MLAVEAFPRSRSLPNVAAMIQTLTAHLSAAERSPALTGYGSSLAEQSERPPPISQDDRNAGDIPKLSNVLSSGEAAFHLKNTRLMARLSCRQARAVAVSLRAFSENSIHEAHAFLKLSMRSIK